MNRKNGYPYGSPGSIYRGGKDKDPDRGGGPSPVRIAVVVTILLVVVGGGYMVIRGGGFASLAPFPSKLIALHFQHNSQEIILLPDQQVIVNPRDTLKLLQIRTDGWLSWGTRIVSADLDTRKMTKTPVAIRDLFAQETFETPRAVDLRALLWNRQIGKVSLLVQLDATDWLQKADSTSDVDKKIGYLEKALHENTANVLVKTQLAGLYFDTKRYEDAAKLYREIDESGKSKAISERLLTVYQIMNRVDDALRVYIELIRLSEDQQTFREFLSYLKKKKSKEDAGRYLERHQAEFPRSFQASILLSLAEFSSESKNWSRAASSYEKAIKAGVKDSDVLYNLFVTYKKNEDYDKAANALERYLQKNPNDIESQLQLAELYEKKGSTTQARATYESILKKNPQNKEALTHLISILEKGNDKTALLGLYEKLAQSQPKNKTLQNNLAVLYYEQKKYDKAITAFQAVVASDPKDVRARKYILDIHRKLRNEKGELAMLQELANMDPKESAYQDALYKYYDNKKDYKGMMACFREASEQNPGTVALHKYQLYAAMKLGDKKAAAGELEKLIQLQPNDKSHLRKAADLYAASGDYGQALKKLDAILKIDPNDKQAKDDYLRFKMQSLGSRNPPAGPADKKPAAGPADKKVTPGSTEKKTPAGAAEKKPSAGPTDKKPAGSTDKKPQAGSTDKKTPVRGN